MRGMVDLGGNEFDTLQGACNELSPFRRPSLRHSLQHCTPLRAGRLGCCMVSSSRFLRGSLRSRFSRAPQKSPGLASLGVGCQDMGAKAVKKVKVFTSPGSDRLGS